jgi:hypothetical protein
MKLSDQEQVILKAIGSGVAEISRVIKAVGYPKATVKKVLVRLNEKGIVNLYRHDWPQSLAPAERKLMVKIGSNYYNAVSVMRKNPKQSKGKTVANPMGWVVYRDSKGRGWDKQLSTIQAAHQMAKAGNADVAHRRRQGKSDTGRFIAMTPEEYRNFEGARWKFKDGKYVFVAQNPKKSSKGKTALKKTGRALKGFARGALQSGAEILGAGAMALNPSRKRKKATKKNKTVIRAKRVVVLNPKKKPAKKAVKRRRNLDHKDSRHQVEVSRHWRAGGLSQWQRAHKAGQKDLFGHGIKARNPEIIWQVDNYNKTAKSAAEEFARTYWQEQRKIRGLKPDGTFKVVGGIRTYRVRKDGRLFAIEVVAQNPRKRKAKRNAPKSRTTKSVSKRRAGASRKTANRSRVRSVAKSRKAPVKRASKRAVKRRNPSITRQQALVYAKDLLAKGNKPLTVRATLHGHGFNEKSALEIVRKAAYLLRNAPKRNNPSAESIRKEFAGSVNGERDLFFPQGTPAGKLAKLGKLVSITTEEGTIKPVSGSAWLCADTKGKLHIGSTSGAPLFDGPKRSFGHVTKLEYESTKPHLGYKGPIIWFHRAGEENGIRPTLHADGKGGIVFRGGDYRLTRRGIEN